MPYPALFNGLFPKRAAFILDIEDCSFKGGEQIDRRKQD